MSAAGSTGATETSQQDTPWAWIAAIAIAAVLALVAAFLFGRRAAARRQWRAAAVQAGTDGSGLHDAGLTVLIAAATDNQPTAWSAVTGSADALLANLQTLQASARTSMISGRPRPHSRRSPQRGLRWAMQLRLRPTPPWIRRRPRRCDTGLTR